MCFGGGGIRGIESSDGKACCRNSCGQCGGDGCEEAGPCNGGVCEVEHVNTTLTMSVECCADEIVNSGEACSLTKAAPCYIDGRKDDSLCGGRVITLHR